MSSQTSTWTTRPGTSLGGEQQVRPERHLRAGEEDLAAHVVAGRELAPLVELAVRRQVRLGRDPEQPAAVDDDRAVVDPAAVPQRGAEHEHRQQVGGALDDRRDRRLDAVEHGVLEQQVLDRVAREAQLREERDRDALVRARPRLAEHGVGVRGRIGDRHVRRAGGDPGEAVLVDAAEVHGRGESYSIAARGTGRPLATRGPRRGPGPETGRGRRASQRRRPRVRKNGELPSPPDGEGSSIALHWAFGGRAAPPPRWGCWAGSPSRTSCCGPRGPGCGSGPRTGR